jgi:predicted ArsR family transcriptional regulator
MARTVKTGSARANLDDLGDARAGILAFLKRRGGGSVADVASQLEMTYEGARQHLVQLEKLGWITKRVQRGVSAEAGRPVSRYQLTVAGEQLFPKHYDALTLELLDTVPKLFGAKALKQLLAALTDERVRQWAPRLEGKSLEQRVTALQGLYAQEDAYMSVTMGGDGIRLVERNCPFFNVASQRPALCSVTVSALQRLLGVKVVREQRFQAGDGCCVFRVLPEQPIDGKRFRFALERET